MMVYKLTKPDMTTHGGCLWGENVTHETDGTGDLCGPGWLHYYEHPLLAVLHNPRHANYEPYLLWEAEADGEIKRDRQMKAGCTKLTTLRVIDAPAVTNVQRVAYGIHCAVAVYTAPAFLVWANAWLDGSDRTAAAASATTTAGAAAWAAWAAANPARAARAVAWAAEAAEAAAELDLVELAQTAMEVV